MYTYHENRELFVINFIKYSKFINFINKLNKLQVSGMWVYRVDCFSEMFRGK